MIYVAKGNDNIAMVFDTEEQVLAHTSAYFVVDAIPDGVGLLMTDGKSLWWEPRPYAQSLRLTQDEINAQAIEELSLAYAQDMAQMQTAILELSMLAAGGAQ